MKKEDIGMESSFTEMKFLIQILTEEILVVAALRKTEFEYQDESDQYLIFG